MKQFKLGDNVETIDDAISGTVSKIEGSTIFVEDTDGFITPFEANELILIESAIDLKYSVSATEIDAIKQQKENKKPKKIKAVKAKERHTAKFEVDLHIHHLTSSSKRMTNYDMLNLQLDTARRQLEFAIKKRIPKLVFIHGVGEGVLKQELETLLGRYNNISFYDADFKTYGFGATEVRVFQNANT